MKNFTIALLLLPILGLGQITITDSDMPASGTDYFHSIAADFSSVDQNLTGTNYTWDFSNLTYALQDTTAVVSVGSTPIAYQFYFNNAFLYPDHYSDYAVEADGLDAFGMITIDSRYDYFQVESGALNLVGYGANVNGVPSSVAYDTIDQIYPLPLNYGTTDSTSAYYISTIPTLGTYGQWIRRKVEVDGWGSITTPFSTYDALRVKTTLYQRDTLHIDQFGFGQAFDRPTEVIYEWLAAGEGVPVFVIEETAGAITEVRYTDDIHVNVAPIARERLLNVYPNPANDIVTLQLPNDRHVWSYQLVDITGRLIDFAQLGEVMDAQIDLSNLIEGTYMLNVFKGDRLFKSKPIIKK